jgi:hypothetical protein
MDDEPNVSDATAKPETIIAMPVSTNKDNEIIPIKGTT